MSGKEQAAWPAGMLGRLLAGKIEIRNYVGGGGMGAVFRAHHRTLDKIVAVKVMKQTGELDALRSQRFAREAQAAARFDHPNAVRILDFGEDGQDGLLYLVMEYLDGRDLDQILERTGPMEPQKIAELMMSALAALAAAHEQGVIHRDLKPANIMVVRRPDDEGRLVDFVKVCDFGLAKIFTHDARERERDSVDAQPGKVVGTPLYMSPEQAIGEPVDARSDVYSAGVVMFEMLTGRPPFEAETKMAVMLKHVSDPPPALSSLRPGIDPALERLVHWTLEKDREVRCPSARELRRALGNYLRGGASQRILTGDLLLGVGAGEAPLSSHPTASVLEPFSNDDRHHEADAWSSSSSIVPLGDDHILGPASGVGDALTAPPLPAVNRAQSSQSSEALPDSAFLPPDEDMDALVAEAVLSVSQITRTASLPGGAPLLSGVHAGAEPSALRRNEHLWKRYGILSEPYAGEHPFWARDHTQQILGPLAYSDLLRVLKREGSEGHGPSLSVSPDQSTWQSGSTFVKLSGQEALFERPGTPVIAKSGGLHGSLDKTSFAALFARVAKEAPTGRLLFYSSSDFDRRVEIHLVRGRPTYVYASDLAFELPQLLVDKRLITAEMLPKFMHRVLSEERPLDEVIGRATGLDIVQYRPVFMKARLLHLFGWKRKGTSYALETQSLPQRLTPFAGSLLQVLPELVYLSSTQDSLQQAVAPYLGMLLERSERFGAGIAEMGLTPSQRTMAARFGKPRTLAASLECEPAEAKMHLALAYVLLETGLLLRPL